MKAVLIQVPIRFRAPSAASRDVPEGTKIAPAAASYSSPWVHTLLNFSQPELERAAHRSLCLEELKESYVRVIQTLVPPGQPVVLLGLSKRMEPEQALLLYGEVLGLLSAGANLIAMCDIFDRECTKEVVNTLPPNGTVLIHGGCDVKGSSMGALLHGEWVRIIQQSRQHRLVLLPQVHWFRPHDHTTEGQVKSWVHPDAHLLVTSQQALEYSNNHFGEFFRSVNLIPHPAVNFGHIHLPRWVHKSMQIVYVGLPPPENEHSREAEFREVFASNYSYAVFNWTEAHSRLRVRKHHEQLARSFLLEQAFSLSTMLARVLRQGRVLMTQHLPVVLISLLADIHVISLDSTDIMQELSSLYGKSENCFAGFRYLSAENMKEALRIVQSLYQKGVVPV